MAAIVEIKSYQQIILVSYHPLCKNTMGVNAINKYGIPPFVDNSCRREPDFQNPHPSITALCRRSVFAPYLKKDDIVIYMTVGGSKKPYKTGYHIVAMLKVEEVYKTHKDAYQWYKSRNIKIPANCMTRDNPPLPYNMTAGKIIEAKKMYQRQYSLLSATERKEYDREALRIWNNEYTLRARQFPVFVRTSSLFMDLVSPIAIRREQLIELFGKIPILQRYKKMTTEELVSLMKYAHVDIRFS